MRLEGWPRAQEPASILRDGRRRRRPPQDEVLNIQFLGAGELGDVEIRHCQVRLAGRAKDQGYHSDRALCPDDAPGGRPHPWMCLQLAIEFRLSATSAAVKIGDTVSDIEEALNAGMWAIGVAATGNEIGLSAQDLAALAEDDRRGRIEAARGRLLAAGAHYAVDSAACCEAALDEIDGRLSAGDRP